MSKADATGEAGGHFQCPVIQVSQCVLAHGEHDGLCSMVALSEQCAGPAGDFVFHVR